MNAVSSPPVGRVTFLFTDIEGSTRLWEQQTEAMEAALARHDALLRHTITTHGGHIFKTMGDAFYAAFARVEDAVQATVAAQQALGRELPQVRVRMALHTGEATLRDDDYFGPAVNRVARLLEVGHGGQVLLSQATAEPLGSSLPAETRLRSLGRHRLRGIAGSDTLFQLLAPSLPSDFPPLNTLNVAFYKGIRRASVVFGVILAIIGALAISAIRSESRARRLAEERRRGLYAAQMNLAQELWQGGDVERARELLVAQHPGAGAEDLRGFEWRHLWRLCRQAGARVTLEGARGFANSVQFSPDGRLLAFASENTVHLWDVATQRTLAVLRGHTDKVGPVAFSPRASRFGRVRRLLASGGEDRTVRLWHIPDRRQIATFRGHRDPVQSLVFSRDGRTLVSSGGDWQEVAAGRGDCAIRLWDVATRQVRSTLRGHNGEVLAVVYSPDGRIVASGSNDGTAKLWDAMPHPSAEILRAHPAMVVSVAFSPNGRFLAARWWDSGLHLWDVATQVSAGGRQRTVASHAGEHRPLRGSLAFSPDGKNLASSSEDGTVKIWNTMMMQEVSTLHGHTPLMDVAFSPDGNLLASCGEDGTVPLWRAGPPMEASSDNRR